MTKNNSNIDYGQSFEKAFRNPGLIHRIQDALLEIDELKLMTFGILGASIVAYGRIAPNALIRILSKADRNEVIALIGKETMNLIDEYMEGEKEDANDLPDGLFNQNQPR